MYYEVSVPFHDTCPFIYLLLNVSLAILSAHSRIQLEMLAVANDTTRSISHGIFCPKTIFSFRTFAQHIWTVQSQK